MRSPRRTSAALRGAVDHGRHPVERILERSVRDGEPREHLRSEKRVRGGDEIPNGPNPSPARPAAATAPLQSGWTASWFAAKGEDLVAGDELTGSPRACSKSASSLATASPFVSPPMSMPATRVPAASSLREPANARPTRTASAAAPAMPSTGGRTTARRATARDAKRGESARTERNSRGACGPRRRDDLAKNCHTFVDDIGQHPCAFRRLELAVGGGMGCPRRRRSEHEELDAAGHVERRRR